MARVTGLGGVFYKVKDPAATRKWYKEYLELDGEYGPMLNWSDEKGEKPYSLLSHFAENTDYLEPSEAQFMINLRVDDLDAYVEQLKEKGLEILGQIDEGYGKFAWILDCDGIKLEFWQQVDAPES
ncbi:MAG: VOC family protein [Sphingomonadales bacterium]|nr:VOC family protein [Sphingomonadales bacterium]PIX66448.1 MAG: glyoxalase [Sphingomonadales bacterium CG_4_10_14_3_um_filter_58_15]NCO48691.1 VOC family protein [Sphingomonadales bacterium]NCP00712.1 VOC family protein [Sphingomonadales bacterium]NCP25966.1 VOC family protein [Sphingomonadales bacterium]